MRADEHGRAAAGQELDELAAVLIVAAGAVACVAIWLRRRWPIGVALLTVALGTRVARRGQHIALLVRDAGLSADAH